MKLGFINYWPCPAFFEWYPAKIPRTAKEIELVHNYSSTDFVHALNYVCSPLGLDCLGSQRQPSLPFKIIKMMEAKFSDRQPTSQRLPKWMSAAFAPNMVAIKTALEWGILDDAPEIDTAYYRKLLEDEKKAAKPEGKVWSELIHKITALCGKELRKAALSQDGNVTKPIPSKTILVSEEEPLQA